ncbi:MFS transporter [Nocardia flavorosea]|uniref:MFS transporter n=1 Tax=Nocardia flavorosea TaxID=53429 RepID=A0A846YHA1_9NOCA|nr:MFS transporter [Nocardia flavorosea]NKY58377.1 MFS transporter [Nocardia flavorosea]
MRRATEPTQLPAAVPGEQRIGPAYVVMLMLGSCGAFMAYITVLAYSLAVRVDTLAPGRTEYLGYLTGLGGAVSLLAGPVVGVISDRVRTRFGRRRPVLVTGAAVGMSALIIVGLAPNIGVLAVGWVLTVLGWSAAMSSITALQADKLPAHQRGTVAGFLGFAQQGAPVLGVVIAGLLAQHGVLLTVVPGLLGVALLLPLVLFAAETDTRSAVFDEPLSVRTIVRTYRYNPRRYPDFSWEWLGKFCFHSGLALNTTFQTFFLAHRLGLSVAGIAHAVAWISVAGVAAAVAGSVGAGSLSDRLGRRRPFVVMGAAVYAGGSATYAFAHDLPLFLVAACLCGFGLGVFTAVDHAITLDILPDPREAGRFMAIAGLANTVSRSTAPLLAPLLLAVGTDHNYTLLYLTGGSLVLAGGLVIRFRVKGAR